MADYKIFNLLVPEKEKEVHYTVLAVARRDAQEESGSLVLDESMRPTLPVVIPNTEEIHTLFEGLSSKLSESNGETSSLYKNILEQLTMLNTSLNAVMTNIVLEREVLIQLSAWLDNQ